MASSFSILPSSPTGKNRRIEIAGLDLITYVSINHVYVYPSEINIDRFNESLANTLSLWPLVAGRTILENGEHYFIEMCDNPIPVTFVSNNELNEWPLDSTVVLEMNDKLLPTFIDGVQLTKFFNNTLDEPLVRLKLTHIKKSGETVLGISWYHVLGDAASCLYFSNTLSCFYQKLEPILPLPIFERRLWKEDQVDQSLLPFIKQVRDAKSRQIIIQNFIDDQINFDPVNLQFSGEQLAKLRSLVDDKTVTIQDALTAYIVLTLNTYCYHDNDKRRILRADTTINYRGVSDLIAAQGQIANAILTMLSDDFDDPYSLSSIAKAIRRSIIRSRDPTYLESWVATADVLWRKLTKNNQVADIVGIGQNEIEVNSNMKYDWAHLVDFGFTDKCRFYLTWSGLLYLRVYRLNPKKDGNQWLPRDRNGVEVSFRMEKDLKEKFINAWKRDINENFENVKK